MKCKYLYNYWFTVKSIPASIVEESIPTPQSLVNSISIEEDCIPTSFPSFILDESADILTIHSINSLVVIVQTFSQIQIPKSTYCNVSIFNSYYPKARFPYLIRRTKRVQLQFLSYSKSTADFVYNIMTYVTLSNATFTIPWHNEYLPGHLINDLIRN